VERAFVERDGRRDAVARIAFGGMTDRATCRRGLAALEEELRASRTARVLAGIEAALVAAVAAGCAVGLGTGNIEPGARLKLGRAGIAERFAFGGYGRDSEVCSELLRVGAERGARAVGAPVEACRVVVIGDTLKDVAAAHAMGAECLAVATGAFSAAALRECGPRWVFADMEQDGVLPALLDGR
jgi:phosphoglycolate phosphatase-like HAD superfamily hydrolase